MHSIHLIRELQCHVHCVYMYMAPQIMYSSRTGWCLNQSCAPIMLLTNLTVSNFGMAEARHLNRAWHPFCATCFTTVKLIKQVAQTMAWCNGMCAFHLLIRTGWLYQSVCKWHFPLWRAGSMKFLEQSGVSWKWNGPYWRNFFFLTRTGT